MKAQGQGAALRQLKQIMIRIMKGEAAMRLEVWRQQMKMGQYQALEAMKAALESQMKAQGQSAGLRILRQILARLTKSEIGVRMEVWRTAMTDDVRAGELEALRNALEAQMKSQGQSAGLRILRQILARMVKGEVGLAIEVWRTTMKDEVRALETFLIQNKSQHKAGV